MDPGCKAGRTTWWEQDGKWHWQWEKVDSTADSAKASGAQPVPAPADGQAGADGTAADASEKPSSAPAAAPAADYDGTGAAASAKPSMAPPAKKPPIAPTPPAKKPDPPALPTVPLPVAGDLLFQQQVWMRSAVTHFLARPDWHKPEITIDPRVKVKPMPPLPPWRQRPALPAAFLLQCPKAAVWQEMRQ